MTAITPQRLAGLGWKPELPDQRDAKFDHSAVLNAVQAAPPAVVDFRGPNMPPVYDQGNLGSCVGNGVAAAYHYIQRKQGLEDYAPSRLFIYFAAREIEGSINDDAGCFVRDGLKVVNKLGAPHEQNWGYVEGQFNRRPDPQVYTDANKHRAIAYESVEVSVTAVKAALIAGYPVIVGFTVYQSFWRISRDGIMPIPEMWERVEGGHCVLVVGYLTMKDHQGVLTEYAICRNSWGATWGDKGYFYIPLAWLCNRDNADDFWAITAAEV